MNNAEKNIIDSNLDELIQNTECNIVFIAILERCGILHGNEAASLGSQHRANNTERAYKLYSLLKTRTDSYSKLQDALLKTCQTGALQILNNPDNHKYIKYESLTYDACTPVTRIGNTVALYQGTFGTRKALVKLFESNCPNKLSQAVNELDMLTRFDWHGNIVRCFIGKFVTTTKYGQQFAIALDYKYSLSKTLLSADKHNLTMKKRVSLVNQILDAVGFLHKNNILHLNLKTSSLFIDYMDDNCTNLRLGEFGLAHQLEQEQKNFKLPVKMLQETGAGSFYTPEVLNSEIGEMHFKSDWEHTDACVNYKTDIFCLGIIIVIILTGDYFPFADEFEMIHNIRKNKIKIDDNKFPNLSFGGKHGLQAALSGDPEERPKIQDLKSCFKKHHFNNIHCNGSNG